MAGKNLCWYFLHSEMILQDTIVLIYLGVHIDLCFQMVLNECDRPENVMLRDLISSKLSTKHLKETVKDLIQFLRKHGVVQGHGEARGTKLKSCVVALLACAATLQPPMPFDSVLLGWQSLLCTLQDHVLVVSRNVDLPNPFKFVAKDDDQKLTIRKFKKSLVTIAYFCKVINPF